MQQAEAEKLIGKPVEFEHFVLFVLLTCGFWFSCAPLAFAVAEVAKTFGHLR